MPADRICVAQIGAPHGVRGEVRLFAYTEDPLAVTEVTAPLTIRMQRWNRVMVR